MPTPRLTQLAQAAASGDQDALDNFVIEAPSDQLAGHGSEMDAVKAYLKAYGKAAAKIGAAVGSERPRAPETASRARLDLQSAHDTAEEVVEEQQIDEGRARYSYTHADVKAGEEADLITAVQVDAYDDPLQQRAIIEDAATAMENRRLVASDERERAKQRATEMLYEHPLYRDREFLDEVANSLDLSGMVRPDGTIKGTRLTVDQLLDAEDRSPERGSGMADLMAEIARNPTHRKRTDEGWPGYIVLDVPMSVEEKAIAALSDVAAARDAASREVPATQGEEELLRSEADDLLREGRNDAILRQPWPDFGAGTDPVEPEEESGVDPDRARQPAPEAGLLEEYADGRHLLPGASTMIDASLGAYDLARRGDMPGSHDQYREELAQRRDDFQSSGGPLLNNSGRFTLQSLNTDLVRDMAADPRPFAEIPTKERPTPGDMSVLGPYLARLYIKSGRLADARAAIEESLAAPGTPDTTLNGSAARNEDMRALLRTIDLLEAGRGGPEEYPEITRIKP